MPQEFAVLREKAITLQGLESSNKDVVTVDFKDMNKKNINVASNVNSLVIVNIDYKELASNTPLYINNQSNQILLFNVVSMPEDGEASINSQINYNSRNNQETENFMDANILWNFGTTNATVVVNRPFQGTILAPNSNIIANQNIDGSIISKYVTINAESHRWDLNSFTITPNDEQNSTETTTSQSDEQGVIGGNASSNYDHNSTDDTIYLPQTGSATSSGLISLGAILSSLSGLFIFRRNRK
ncbi:choice-of-anchor A family protein [Vagococcus fluvialis]|nr:choice-of-anchor A family protein [Vagococcus fluvialis]